MRATPRLRRRDDSGFTLIEVTVTVLIILIIIGPITAAFIVGFDTVNAAANRLSGSDDRQLVQLYFPSDVESSSVASVPPMATSCTVPVGGTLVLALAWNVINVSGTPPTTTTSLANPNTEADYVLFTSPGTPLPGQPQTQRLVRYLYSPASNHGSCTLGSTQIVAFGLTMDAANPPCSAATVITCATVTPVTGSTRNQVSLTLTDPAGGQYTLTELERS